LPSGPATRLMCCSRSTPSASRVTECRSITWLKTRSLRAFPFRKGFADGSRGGPIGVDADRHEDQCNGS
jgi:hypothetical protein